LEFHISVLNLKKKLNDAVLILLGGGGRCKNCVESGKLVNSTPPPQTWFIGVYRNYRLSLGPSSLSNAL